MTDRACSQCGHGPLGPRNKTGECRVCSVKRTAAARRKPKQHCSGCGKELVKSRTGRCIPCFNAYLNSDPEIAARRAAGVNSWIAENPDNVSMRARRGARTRSNNPEYMARLREMVRTKIQPLSQAPEVLARQDYAARGKAITKAKLPWCPDHLLGEYRFLRRGKALPAAEARAIILAQIKVEEAKLSPFERQMRALERGGKLIANDLGPSLDRPAVYDVRSAG